MLDTLQLRSRAVPPEPPRRRGATTTEPDYDRFGTVLGLLRAVPWLQVGLGAAIVLAAAMVPWGTGKLLGAMDQQIMTIDVNGDFIGDSRNAIERQAGKWVGKSFFATDLSDIKADLERRPWVDSAAVRRVWPDRLVVNIREKKPLAYWGDGRLVSRKGEVFTPANPEVAGTLPTLSGPDEQVREVIDMARSLSDRLAAHGLGFAGLSLASRGAWTLSLANGIQVELGRDQVAERFDRFLTVYESRLASHAAEVSRIDARYGNGVAVRWKRDEPAGGPKS